MSRSPRISVVGAVTFAAAASAPRYGVAGGEIGMQHAGAAQLQQPLGPPSIQAPGVAQPPAPPRPGSRGSPCRWPHGRWPQPPRADPDALAFSPRRRPAPAFRSAPAPAPPLRARSASPCCGRPAKRAQRPPPSSAPASTRPARRCRRAPAPPSRRGPADRPRAHRGARRKGAGLRRPDAAVHTGAVQEDGERSPCIPSTPAVAGEHGKSVHGQPHVSPAARRRAPVRDRRRCLARLPARPRAAPSPRRRPPERVRRRSSADAWCWRDG